jgi:hypothetical protein
MNQNSTAEYLSEVVPREISHNHNHKHNLDAWKKHQRIKPEVVDEFATFTDFVTSEMHKGRNGFRTRPGVDKFRFLKKQSWFPTTSENQVAFGKALAMTMIENIPAIKDRFYVKVYFNPAGTPQNMSDKDLIELQIRDLKPKSVPSAGPVASTTVVPVVDVSAGTTTEAKTESAPVIQPKPKPAHVIKQGGHIKQGGSRGGHIKQGGSRGGHIKQGGHINGGRVQIQGAGSYMPTHVPFTNSFDEKEYPAIGKTLAK